MAGGALEEVELETAPSPEGASLSEFSKREKKWFYFLGFGFLERMAIRSKNPNGPLANGPLMESGQR